MIRSVSLALAVCVTPVVAQTGTDVLAMTAAIEAAGCVVTAENGDAVLATSGLDEDQTMVVIAQLYEDGLVDLQADGSMKLTNDTCP